MYVLTVFMSVCTVAISKMITVKAPGQIVLSGYMLMLIIKAALSVGSVNAL